MPLYLVLLLLALIASPGHAAPSDNQFYRKAFSSLGSNNADQAESYASRGRDPVLNKVLRGYAMALPGNDYSFSQIENFIADNPGWPGLKLIQMIVEQKIPSNTPPPQVAAWFAKHPPITLFGFYRYIDALNQSGQADTAITAIRARWIEGDFNGDELTAYYARFGALLDGHALWARMDRLLWKGDDGGALRLMPYLNPTDKTVAEARLSLAALEGNAAAWVARVPPDAQNDPGLLYQKLRWLVKKNDDTEAYDMLLRPPIELGNPAAWWELRQIMVRRAIERQDFALAYRTATNHGQTDLKPLTQAEFLCGWLALRFLNSPQTARQHFQTLLDNASTPITRARGAYWLGRAYEALGDRAAAEQAYQDAAALDTTYYGQLATTRIDQSPIIKVKSDPPIPEPVRRTFMARDMIRSVTRLNDIGEFDRSRAFFRAAQEVASERADFILLTEISARIHRPDLGILVVKAAAQKDILIKNGGFPIVIAKVPTPPEAALTHALIRQESQFAPDAVSPVGARGLMQVMPRTAKEVARKSGLRYSESRLSEPTYNIKLGTSFVQQQIERFDGSYILALAGYNAGPARVREWLGQFGDPRKPEVDAIDWVELIPIQETRNYVQRIMENLQIYRAKLAGGQAPLQIYNDLKR